MTTVSKAIKTAQYFIHKSNIAKSSDDPSIVQNYKWVDSLKLNKLVYYAEAWSLALNNKSLYNDPILAWIHGPVIYDVWDTYKGIDKQQTTRSNYEEVKSLFDAEDIELLDEIYEEYGKFTGQYLETLTHREFPWQKKNPNH